MLPPRKTRLLPSRKMAAARLAVVDLPSLPVTPTVKTGDDERKSPISVVTAACDREKPSPSGRSPGERSRISSQISESQPSPRTSRAAPAVSADSVGCGSRSVTDSPSREKKSRSGAFDTPYPRSAILYFLSLMLDSVRISRILLFV